MTEAVPVNDRFTDLSPSTGATELSYDFELRQAEDLLVVLIRAGAETTLELTTDYTFPAGLGDDSGGTLTLTAATQAGDRFLLIGMEEIERLSDFAGSQKFSSTKFNADLDAVVRIHQEARRDIGRAIKVAYGESGPRLDLLAEGHFWKADADGNLVDGGSAQDVEDAQANAEAAETAKDDAEAAAAAAAAALASLGAVLTGDIQIKTDDYTIVPADIGDTLVMNSGDAKVFTLPEAATAGEPWQVRLLNIGAGLVTYQRAGADTVNGATSLTLGQYEGAVLNSDGVSAWYSDAAAAVVSDDQITRPKLATDVRAGMLADQLRSAEVAGPGACLDGKGFVDLLCSTATLDAGSSSNWRFAKGGIAPAYSAGSAADAALSSASGSNSGWTGYTLVFDLTEAAIDDAAEDCDFIRLTFRAGTGGGLTISSCAIGVAGASAPDFDPAFPVTAVTFDGGDFGDAATAGNAIVSDTVEYTIPAGKGLRVAVHVSAGGFVATSTKTGWNTYHKTSVNEPGKIDKSGYSGPLSTILGLERIEYFGRVESNMTVVSAQLPLSDTPAKADVMLALDCDSGDVGDIALSLSRDGATWSAVTLATQFTRNGKIIRAAFGHDLSAGAGSGDNIHYRLVTSNNKAIKACGLIVATDIGIFTDVPSVDMAESAPLVTFHPEATGLGYVSSGIKYGRLWGFTQDWEVKGPTRFRIKAMVNLVHNGGAVASDPVAWVIALSRTIAASLAALGAKDYTETDTTPFTGNDALTWLGFDSGNITNVTEHYKTATIVLTWDFLPGPGEGAVRLEMWGHSATSADSGVANHIGVNWTESTLTALAGGLRYNRLEVTAQVLR